jgi:hypothetical protein
MKDFELGIYLDLVSRLSMSSYDNMMLKKLIIKKRRDGFSEIRDKTNERINCLQYINKSIRIQIYDASSLCLKDFFSTKLAKKILPILNDYFKEFDIKLLTKLCSESVFNFNFGIYKEQKNLSSQQQASILLYTFRLRLRKFY